MRKITVMNRISIDGFFASLNEKTWGMDWFIGDPEVDKALHASGESTTLILGGITYRGFVRSWVPMLSDPNAPAEIKAVAKELTQMTKLVFSKTLKETTWENTRLFPGNLSEEIRKLKQGPGDNMLIMGSGSIIQQLTQERLIDDYIFIVTPVIAGIGKSMFKDVKQLDLKLLETKSFKSGNVLLHYTI